MYVEDIEALLRQEVPEITIGVLGQQIADALSSQTRFVRLSWKTIHKQQIRHPDIGFREYVLLPHLIERGLVIHESRSPTRINILYRETSERAFVATINVTRDRQRLYVLRLHRARKKTPIQLQKKGPILRPHR